MANRRLLPPWEEITYFQSPKGTVTTLPVALNVWTPIAQANPNRVALYISASGACNVSPDNSISFQGGIPLSNTQPPLAYYEATDANMCTAQWFGCNGSGVFVTVIEISLREWPDK